MATELTKPVKRETLIGDDRYHVVLDYRGLFMRKVSGDSRKWQCTSWAALAGILVVSENKPTAAPVEEDALPEVEAEEGDDDI